MFHVGQPNLSQLFSVSPFERNRILAYKHANMKHLTCVYIRVLTYVITYLSFVFSKIHFVEHSFIQISMFELITCSHYETRIFYSLK